MSDLFQQLQWVHGTKNTTADVQILAAPGKDKQLILRIVVLSNQTAGQILTFKDASGGNILYPQFRLAANDNIQTSFYRRVGENKALFMGLGTAAIVEYSLGYEIESKDA